MTIKDERLALFLLLGQTATREIAARPDIAPPESLHVSELQDLTALLPEASRLAFRAAEAYKLFFVFETYLRELLIEVLSKDGTEDWWAKLPTDVQEELAKLEETEDTKSWMALGSRDKSALMTYPQLLRSMEHRWKSDFEDLIRDRALIQQARLIGHLRNTTCHMSAIPEEEMERVRQTIRDWFRRVAP